MAELGGGGGGGEVVVMEVVPGRGGGEGVPVMHAGAIKSDVCWSVVCNAESVNTLNFDL